MVGKEKWTYGLYRRPLAAQAYFLLGDYQTTLRVLQDFEPATLRTAGFDSRWGMLGRVRLLRAAAYEQLGRRAEAREEYRQVLAQWSAATRRSSRSCAGGAGAGPGGRGVGRRARGRAPIRSAILPATLGRVRWSRRVAKALRGKSELQG